MDGPRAQAREAGGFQPPRRRGTKRFLRNHRGRHGRAAHGPLRDHPRHRYAASARVGLPHGGRHGASAQPPPARFGHAAGHLRLRSAPASGGGQPDGGAPVALFAPTGRSRGPGPLYTRGLQRLSGPVRSRILRRQGHLRRPCLSCGRGQPLPRQPHLEPRLDRRAPRALRLPQRGGALRKRALSLPGRHEPAPSLDPRRLADRALAVPPRAGPRRPSRTQSARRPRALDDPGQSPPQPRAAGAVHRAGRGGVPPAGIRGAVDRGTADGVLPARGRPVGPRVPAETSPRALADSPAPCRGDRAPAMGRRRPAARLPPSPERGVSRCDRAGGLAPSGPAAPPGMENRQPQRARRAALSPGRRPGDVDGARLRAGMRGGARTGGSCRRRRPFSAVRRLGRIPRRRMVCQPIRRRTPPPSGPGAGRVSPGLGAADVGVLRAFRRAGAQLAAARQRSGSPRVRRREPDIADQYRHDAGGRPGRLRFRLHLGGPLGRPHGEHHGGAGEARALPRPLLQLVRHADSAAAAPALHLHGGQRQLGRSDDRGARRPGRDAPRRHPARPLEGRHRGYRGDPPARVPRRRARRRSRRGGGRVGAHPRAGRGGAERAAAATRDPGRAGFHRGGGRRPERGVGAGRDRLLLAGVLAPAMRRPGGGAAPFRAVGLRPGGAGPARAGGRRLGRIARGTGAHPRPRRAGDPAAPLGAPPGAGRRAGIGRPVAGVAPHGQRARRRAHHGHPQARRPVFGAERARSRFPLRSGPPPAVHRLQP